MKSGLLGAIVTMRLYGWLAGATRCMYFGVNQGLVLAHRPSFAGLSCALKFGQPIVNLAQRQALFDLSDFDFELSGRNLISFGLFHNRSKNCVHR